MQNQDYILGSIYGLLVGDALAYPYKNLKNIKEYDIIMTKNNHEDITGSWTSSGSFSLAIMESIIENDGINLEYILDKFLDVYIAGQYSPDEECKDTSPITSESLQNYTNGLPFDKCGITKTTFDNDCLLRMLPVGLYLANSNIENVVDQAHKVCSITHNNVYSKVCCAVFCLIIRNILLQKAEKVFDLLDEHYRTKQMNDYLDALNNFKKMSSTTLSNTRNINDTFWGAWSIFSSNQQNTEKALIHSIHMGGDINRRTALVGLLSGLSNGISDIPEKWLSNLKVSIDIKELINNFTKIIQRKIR